jgi:eukaryotic-like serine/threonine-protein kinase
MAKTLANQSIGPFTLREIIGAGGIAEVYRADHYDDGRHYAVKVMRPERAAEKAQVKNFLEEFDTLQALKHPSIPVARRQGELDGRPAFVMDLIAGSNLATLQAQAKSFPGVQALFQLCAVADYLHQQDIIHNDLKLENCMIRPDGQLVLVDYGSVRYPRRTSLLQRIFSKPTTQIFGTATYLAPELIQGQRPTFRSDVYALGVCAFYMLSGKPPFEAARQSGRLRANLNAAPPSIAQRVPDIHPGVASILDACLSKDPEKRPMAASEVHAAAKLHLDKLRESAVIRAKELGARKISASLRATLNEGIDV